MTLLTRSLAVGLLTLATLIGACLTAQAADGDLRVKVFPGPVNLALFAAREKGFFAKRGLKVEIQFTVNSKEQRDGLASGAFEIAQSGVDNAVALVEGAKADIVIVAGGSNGMNEFVVRPEISSFADLRGKKVVVDAPDTAYALLAYKVLALEGIARDQYGVTPAGGCPQRLAAMKADPLNAAAMLNLPCNLLAVKEGFKSFGAAVDKVGPYQADGVWVRREWAKANAERLIAYLQACIEGYRWAADPANRLEVNAMVARVLNLSPEIAAGSVELAVGPNPGLAKDLKFDLAGFKNTLQLRAEMQNGDPNAAPQKYLDLSFYDRALGGL